MQFDKPYYAFVAGEVSPELFARTDLAKFDLGVAKAKNFFVDYRGGMVSRPGTEYIAFTPKGEGYPIFCPFKGSAGDYLLVFTNNRLRFIFDGGYVLEPLLSVLGITQAASAVFTATAHGYVIGDVVYINAIAGMSEVNNRYYIVESVPTANTFTLKDDVGDSINSTTYGAFTAGGFVSRVYTVVTSYTTAIIPTLRFDQKLNDLQITSVSIRPQILTFVSSTNWALTNLDTGSNVVRPASVTLNPSSSGTAGLAVAVTAVKDGEESLPSNVILNELSVNYSLVAGSLRVSWAYGADVDYWNVYRSLIYPTGAQVTKGEDLGFLGRSYTTQFIDTNIVPDFTKLPPINFDPFETGTIIDIEVTNGGSGYTKTGTTVSVAGGAGSGFSGEVVVSDLGIVLSVRIRTGGQNYVSPVVTITGPGTLATATATASSLTGQNPRVSRSFQQRRVFAGTVNSPMGIFATKPETNDNFDISQISNAGDGYFYTLDSQTVQPIKALVALRSGLLIFTEDKISLLRAETGRAVSAVNALAEDQVFNGASDVEPITLSLDVLFIEQGGGTVYAMKYTEYTESFTLLNVSTLSAHLIGKDKEPVAMVQSKSPHKLVHFVKEDGNVAVLTYEPEQEVFAWTEYLTQGYYLTSASLLESNVNVPYYAVERYINGSWRYYIEREVSRNQLLDEDHFCVDSGLANSKSTFSADIEFSQTTGVSTVTATAAAFASDVVGDILHAAGGKLEVTSRTSSTLITGTWLRDPAEIKSEGGVVLPLRVREENWQIITPITEVSGLWHLEGSSVSVLADGDAFLNLTVTNGAITLEQPATKVVVGLAYNCDLETLPLATVQATIEAKLKRILGVAVERYKSRGLFIGPDEDSMYEVKERTDQDWGENLGLFSESIDQAVNYGYETRGQIFLRQPYPLPATILGMFLETDVGDD
tara:strand:- start:19135 stop:21927 length:2793 start_codon:yes stop_codon:yes gene_type:complete